MVHEVRRGEFTTGVYVNLGAVKEKRSGQGPGPNYDVPRGQWSELRRSPGEVAFQLFRAFIPNLTAIAMIYVIFDL